MSVYNDSSRLRHFPKNPDRFEFDEEVTDIFDDMAERSIPAYNEARRLTVLLALNHIALKAVKDQRVYMADVGASTGAFYKDLWDALGYDVKEAIPWLTPLAIDSSRPMIAKMRQELPRVYIQWADATVVNLQGIEFDVVNMAYLLQFIDPGSKREVLDRVYDSMKPGGMLIISNKEYVADAGFSQGEYLNFRLANGYTIEEIRAKTRALAAAMTPISDSKLRTMLMDAGFEGLHGVCRWLQFSTYIMYKPE